MLGAKMTYESGIVVGETFRGGSTNRSPERLRAKQPPVWLDYVARTGCIAQRHYPRQSRLSRIGAPGYRREERSNEVVSDLFWVVTVRYVSDAQPNGLHVSAHTGLQKIVDMENAATAKITQQTNMKCPLLLIVVRLRVQPDRISGQSQRRLARQL